MVKKMMEHLVEKKDLVKELDESNLGAELGNEIISGLFYCDDIFRNNNECYE